jgi:hypothetical protein
MAPNIGPGHASPIQDGTDATDYLFTDDLPEDLYSMLYPGTDQFNDNIFLEQVGQEGIAFPTNQAYYMMGTDAYALPNNFENGTPNVELQLDQENDQMNLPNGNVDTGIAIRSRRATASPANISLAYGNIKMQVGIKRMVTSNSESINQTMKFTHNSGRRLDLRTDVEHQKKNTNNVISAKQSDAAKTEGHSNQGYLKGFKRCSSAGFKSYIFVAFFVVGVAAAAAALHYHRSGANL